MSWYHKDWKYRAPIMINNHSGAGQIDVTATVPGDWPLFWENVDASNSGADVRVTLADGNTLATFDLESFNSTTKTCTVEINDMAVNNTDGAVVAWIYFGATGKSSAETSFSVSSAKTGFIEIGRPGSGSQRMITCRPERPGTAVASIDVHKHSAEILHLWWDLTGVISTRFIPNEGRRLLDEVESVNYQVTFGGSEPQSAMIDTTQIRMVDPAYVRTTIKAGNSGSNYLAILTVNLTSGRKLDFRCRIVIKDVTA